MTIAKTKLRLVEPAPCERIYGSSAFIRRTRNPAKVSGWPFMATRKEAGDVVI